MVPMDRREFLKRSLTATAALAVAPTVRGAPMQAQAPHVPEPCPPAAWRKHGVVLEPSEPWEGRHIQNFTSPVEMLDGDRWRIWYSAIDGRERFAVAYAEGKRGGPMKKVRAQCSAGGPADVPFAIGHLPESWKPVQVIHLRLRSDKHRLYFWAHGDGILRYLAADSDDGRRYTVVSAHRPVLYHFADRAAHGVASPDGVLMHKEPSKDRPADEPLAPPHLISNDATTVYQRPDGSFEMYSVALVSVSRDDPAYVAGDNMPGLLRVIDRYTSEDGLHFENRKRVIERGASDPADQQFYYLAATHTPRGRVGMLGHYRVRAQTMDLEWCFSADGLTWKRPYRAAWVARGQKSDPDSYGVYAPHGLVEHDGEFHLVYTGVNYAHNEKDTNGPPRTVILHATTPSIWARPEGPASRPGV